jgi:hypothetical protein
MSSKLSEHEINKILPPLVRGGNTSREVLAQTLHDLRNGHALRLRQQAEDARKSCKNISPPPLYRPRF